MPRRSVLLFFVLLSLTSSTRIWAQAPDGVGQTVRGRVLDRDTQAPLIGANVILLGAEPLVGSTTDLEGHFVLVDVPLGRHDIQVTYIGYEPLIQPAVLVTSGKEVVLNLTLREQIMEAGEIVVTPGVRKDQPLNDMAYVSARSFSVEETRRYAGGVDDPARMASAFAGVASAGGIQQNALVIRGNAPKGVLWRLEGVDIPNPNHFAGLSVAGGGGLTLFSSHLLADSDFFTGAFPAEYGNALSGVFDMAFRTGNPVKREHAVQVGLLGVEIGSEGPFRRGKAATYLFNYRYSTLGLLMPLLPTEAGTSYQDLSFKLAFPTRLGRFEAWGIGGLDRQTMVENRDSTTWEYEFWDRTNSDMTLGIGAGGVSYTAIIDERTYLRSSLAGTINRTKWNQQRLDDDLDLQPNLEIDDYTSRFLFSTYVNHKAGPRHVNRTGFTIHQLLYRLNVRAASDDIPPIKPLSQGSGRTTLAQAYTQSRFYLSSRLSMSVGAHGQYFALTGQATLEPRAAVQWQVSGRQALSAGYGLHSQIEELRIYFTRLGDGAGRVRPNANLKAAKAHHAVLAYDHSLSAAARLKVETYYQWLFDVPVIPDSSFSLLNFEQDWFFAEAVVNDGVGRNYGLELTLERFFRDGYYYLLTGSLFRSRYRGGDRVWRSSRFDQGYASNFLFGREFTVRGDKLLGLNGRLVLVGGKRRSPVDFDASLARQEVVYDHTRAFQEREPGLFLVDLTATYRLNRRRFAEEWALQIKNAFFAKEVILDYNYASNSVAEVEEGFPLPVLSYKVMF